MENHSGQQDPADVTGVSGLHIVDKTRWAIVRAAHGKSQREREEENTDGIVPIEKLEAVALYALERVGPRSPTDRSSHHHDQGYAKTMRSEHELLVVAASSYSSLHAASQAKSPKRDRRSRDAIIRECRPARQVWLLFS